MTECIFDSSNSMTKKNNKFYDFRIIFSFVLSNPLYFSYFIFFSPYLLKFLSFLSPLFITTSLIFLSLTSYNTLLEKFCPKLDHDSEKLHLFEEFEVYKIVFETPIIEKIEENPIEREKFEENPVGISVEKAPQKQSKTAEVKSGDVKPNKVKEEVKRYEAFLAKSGSKVNKLPISEGLSPKTVSLRVDSEKKFSEAFSQTVGSPSYTASFGSMRKEKEWRRTLACKLFEERHNLSNNGGNGEEEGMDLLWETYETEQNRGMRKEEVNKRGRKKDRIQDLMMINDDYNGVNEEDYDDDNGKLCCLQALKLSAGKMNLSMGRPSLMKIGKAFKGIGWVQSHVRRQSKKEYN